MKALVGYETLSNVHSIINKYVDGWNELKVLLREKSIKYHVNLFGPYRKPKTFYQLITFQKGDLIEDEADLIDAWLGDFNYTSHKIKTLLKLNPRRLGLQGYSEEQIEILKKAASFIYGEYNSLLYPRVEKIRNFLKSYFKVGTYQDYFEFDSAELEVIERVVNGMSDSIKAIQESIEFLK